MVRFWVLLLTLLVLNSKTAVRANPDRVVPTEDRSRITERVDGLFSRWNQRNTPGAAVAVIKDGKTLYKRGYGMASLEYDAPNTPSTLFHIASISKQFTAFAIHLLVQDGRLSLSDDARKYVPELPNFGKPITIRHLLYHTSGLRDQSHLFFLAGWRFEDAMTEQDFLHLVSQQRELNFPTGQEELYTNTGYTLLAIIVKRISGKSLGEFAQERIFKPLGMTHTLFPKDYSFILKNKASSYQPSAGGGYQDLALTDSTLGATGVVTSIEDMVRWDQNFEDARVGGKSVLSAMLQKGVLNNGQEITRASGLGIEEYRGLPVIQHSGAIAGYRSHYVRFPKQHFSVIIFANTADVDATALTRQIADLYLEKDFPPSPAPLPSVQKPREIKLDTKTLDTYVGDYEFKQGNTVTISRENDHLMAQGTGSGRVPLFAASPTTFFLRNSNSLLIFDKPADTTTAQTVILRTGTEDRPGRRIPSAPLSDFVGSFYSAELNVIYTVSLREGKLFLRHPRGEYEMVRTFTDTFVLPFPIDDVRFTRNAQGNCLSFTVDDGRVRNLRFVKVEIVPVEK